MFNQFLTRVIAMPGCRIVENIIFKIVIYRVTKRDRRTIKLLIYRRVVYTYIVTCHDMAVRRKPDQ
jgi:Ni,Fe-hydrogenase I small subunit